MAKPGSQMGTKSRAVLECLSKNPRLNRLDLEMKLSMGQLGPVNNRLFGLGYIKQAGIPGRYEITNSGVKHWARLWRSKRHQSQESAMAQAGRSITLPSIFWPVSV